MGSEMCIRDRHVLDDVLHHGLDVVFCGAAAGTTSARKGAYYSGPGNSFWRILHKIELTTTRLEPNQYEQSLEYGIGLTDLAKRISGPDRGHTQDHYDLEDLLDRLRRDALGLRVLAFNGKRAAACYLYGDHRKTSEVAIGGPQDDSWNVAECVFVLPSTSGGARKFWLSEPWHALASHLGRGSVAKSI